MDYRKLYVLLFNRITDAVECIEMGKTDEAKEILINA